MTTTAQEEHLSDLYAQYMNQQPVELAGEWERTGVYTLAAADRVEREQRDSMRATASLAGFYG